MSKSEIEELLERIAPIKGKPTSSEHSASPADLEFQDWLHNHAELWTPILWELKGVRGVSLIEDELGRRRILPTIIVKAMLKAGRKIKEIKWAPRYEELRAML